MVKEKLLQCPHCEYLPKGRWHLQVHIKAVHEKIKDQKCHLCEFVTSLPHTLKSHIKEVHACIKDIRIV